MTKTREYQIEYGRMDAITPISGLFQVLPKQRGSHKQTVEIIKRVGDIEIELVSPYKLDHIAWKLLVAICGLCGKGQQALTHDPESDHDRELRSLLRAEGKAAEKAGLRWTGSIYRLLIECELPISGKDRNRLYERLKQLASVRQFLDRRVSSANLISFAIDEEGGSISIAVNPQIAKFIMGGKGVQYSRISLQEIRQLSSPAAILLHGQLTAMVRRDRKTPARYGVDTMASWIYGGYDTADTKRYRRGAIRKALKEINSLPEWHVQVSGDVVEVWRGQGGCKQVIEV